MTPSVKDTLGLQVLVVLSYPNTEKKHLFAAYTIRTYIYHKHLYAYLRQTYR